MWILVRVLFAIGVFVHRMIFDRRERVKSEGLRCQKTGQTYFPISRAVDKTIKVVGIMLPLEFPCPFRLTKESYLDRMFKGAGLAREFQINDPRFDDLIYLACDDENLRRVLSETPEARAIFIELFEKGAERIIVDGRHLCIYGFSDHESIAPFGVELVRELSRKARSLKKAGVDPFALKVLLVECLIWSMAGYAIGSAAELLIYPNTVALSPWPLFWRGLFGGLALALGLSISVVLFLRRSSRSHRVLIESFLVLALSMPIVGIQGAFDANRTLDQSAAEIVKARVVSKRIHVSRGRRGGTTTSYFLGVNPQARGDFRFEKELEVGRSFYNAVEVEEKIKIRVRQGAFDVPWIVSMDAESSFY